MINKYYRADCAAKTHYLVPLVHLLKYKGFWKQICVFWNPGISKPGEQFPGPCNFLLVSMKFTLHPLFALHPSIKDKIDWLVALYFTLSIRLRLDRYRITDRFD
jgi:hypothetical protein